MAKIFKVSAYVVDPMDEFNESSLEDYLVWCTQNDISLTHISIEGADIGEWNNDLSVNKLCGTEEF